LIFTYLPACVCVCVCVLCAPINVRDKEKRAPPTVHGFTVSDVSEVAER